MSDQYARSGRKALSDLGDYMRIAKAVKGLAKAVDPDSKVYVFGSAVRGDFTASSDIDILIVSERKELEDEMKLSIYRKVDAPIEVHFSTPQLFEGWYRRFIRDDEIRAV
ncbi:MAG: nucleotidyltransferase domain-containing protein [Conexivisphaerales archaeon]|jgi:predicted nucleotidyltransferase